MHSRIKLKGSVAQSRYVLFLYGTSLTSELQDSELTALVHSPFSADQNEGHLTDRIDEVTSCVQCWTNLADKNTKKHLGIFHETGLFLSVCQHGMALIMCDMVQSGEL